MTHVPQLERDLRDAARRRSRRARLVPRRRRTAAPALVGATLVAAGGAGAATEVLDVGRQEATPRERQADGLRYTAPRTLVAAVRTPLAGRWEMLVTDSDVGPCLGLRLLDDPSGPGLGEGCGSAGAFTVAHISNGFPVDRPELANRWKLVFGRAPERAARVELRARGGFRRSVATHEGPAAIAGDFYLLEVPGTIRRATVRAFAADGRPLGPALDV